MTTNIVDLESGLLTSDSRWSIQPTGLNFLIFIDDTNFDKIAIGHHQNLAFIFAGNGMLIELWKNAVSTGTPAIGTLPFSLNGQSIAIGIIKLGDAPEMIFSKNHDIAKGPASFAGSGSRHACECWLVNKCAKKAVGSASKLDFYTGGEIKYLELSTRNNNLSNTASMSDVHSHLLQRGTVMYTSKPNESMAIEQAAANDPNVKAVVDQMASGELTANAPCDGMYNDWHEREQQELHDILRKHGYK